MSSCIVCASSAGDAVPCCGVCVCQNCLRASAAASGSLFACPACRERDTFRAHAVQKGIHVDEKIPDYVSTGAASTNERLCCAERCRSPRGPAFDTTAERLTRGSAEDQSRWRLIPCLSCGGRAIHAGCSGGRRLVSLARWRAHEAMWRCDDCGGSDEAPELAETPFVIGDRIEARWAGRATWYPGVIEAIDGDRYGILYDDSETESGVAEALIRLEPTSAAPMPALRSPEAHDDASARPVAVPVATGPVMFCVACWTGRRVLRHTCLVGTSAQELLPVRKIPGWLVTACDALAERASGDTVHGVACKIVEHYAHPLLYRNPKGDLWWREKLDACRTSYKSLMDIIEEVASANAYAFHRRLISRVHGISKGARLLRRTTQADRETRAVQLAYALLGKALLDVIAKAKARWAEVQGLLRFGASPGADAVLFAHADELFTKDVVEYFENEIAEYHERNSNGSKSRGDYPPHDGLVVCTKDRPVRLQQFDS